MQIAKLFSNPKTRNILILLLFSLVIGLVLIFTKLRLKSRAAPGVPTLSYAISPSPLQPGQNFDLVLKVNPNGASFYAFELYTNYDPSKVDFQNATTLSSNITSSYLLINSTIDTTNNIITIIGTRTGSAFSGTSDYEIAHIKMHVKTGASGDVNFTWGSNTKLGSDINKEVLDGVFTIGGGGGTISPTAAPVGPDLHLDIPSLVAPTGTLPTAGRSQNVNVQVLLKTDNNQVKSIDFSLPYDDTRLTFQNLTDLESNIEMNPSSGFDSQFVIKKVDTVAKKVIFAIVAPVVNGAPVPISSSSDILLATIKFAVKTDASDGEVDLLPDTTSTIYNMQTQNILACTGGYRFNVGAASLTPTLTPTPTTPPFITDTPIPTNPPVPTNTLVPTTPVDTTTPAGGGSVTLDLKLRLQGIVTRPNRQNSVPIKVTVSSASESVNQSVVTTFNVDSTGFWSGRANLTNVLPASDYKILIKGPMHLQKRFCDVSPSESNGTYNCTDGAITLNAGVNSLDFTGVHLLAGDLPVQDGIVNSYDVSLVRNNIGTTNSTALAQADLNFDGIVDTQDYSLVVAALAIRNDDEL